ncbi:MAG: hypothetical protein ABI307_12140 [Mycobacterium sp.]
MSRIKNCLTVAAGAAAGLFLTALASSATASADTVPLNPGLGGVVEQVFASTATIPQQLLQSTTSMLTGTPLAPAASPGQSPIATATLNMPQTPGTSTPGASTPAGLPGLSGLPGNLSSLLPFPLPNLGGTAPIVAPVAAPSAAIPGALVPSMPVVPSMAEVLLIPSLP